MGRYSITVEFEADTVEEAISLVAVGDIVELLNLDLLMHPPGSARFGGNVEEEFDGESDRYAWVSQR